MQKHDDEIGNYKDNDVELCRTTGFQSEYTYGEALA